MDFINFVSKETCTKLPVYQTFVAVFDKHTSHIWVCSRLQTSWYRIRIRILGCKLKFNACSLINLVCRIRTAAASKLWCYPLILPPVLWPTAGARLNEPRHAFCRNIWRWCNPSELNVWINIELRLKDNAVNRIWNISAFLFCWPVHGLHETGLNLQEI